MSSDSIQTFDEIQPVDKDAVVSSDPVVREYQEGKKFLENGDYGQAAVALHNALVGYEQKEDNAGIANASNQLGHACLLRDDYENALKHYTRAYDICEELNDRMSALSVSNKIVDVYCGLADFKAAINTCLDIVDVYHDNRDPQGMVTILEKLAEVYLASGDKANGADTYRTIASIHKNFKHGSIADEFIKKASALEQ